MDQPANFLVAGQIFIRNPTPRLRAGCFHSGRMVFRFLSGADHLGSIPSNLPTEFFVSHKAILPKTAIDTLPLDCVDLPDNRDRLRGAISAIA